MARSAGRRTQEERSAATRERLLEAAFRCLVEAGFAGTTTTLVCRRSRLSRGALLHHFPSKEELLIAAAEYVFQRRLLEFRAAFRDGAAAGHKAEAAVDLLWRFFSGPTYYAWLELVLASRTGPALRDRLHGLLERFNADAQQIYEELFPPSPGRPAGRTAPRFAFAVLKGLAVDRIVSGDDEGVTRVLRALKGLAAGLEPPG
jgi:AcrR family transcriptional regulator